MPARLKRGPIGAPRPARQPAPHCRCARLPRRPHLHSYLAHTGRAHRARCRAFHGARLRLPHYPLRPRRLFLQARACCSPRSQRRPSCRATCAAARDAHATHTPRTRHAHAKHTPSTRHAQAKHMHMPCACHAHAIAHAVARTVHAPWHAAAHHAAALRGDAPRASLHLPASPYISPYLATRSRASRRCSSRLPTSPYISLHLPTSPHISLHAVALRGDAPRAARRWHGCGRARARRARTPNASSWRGRVAPQPHPCRAPRPNWLWAALRTPDGAPEEWEGPGACSRCGWGAFSCGRSA